jgi:hypothetical protein
MHLNLNAIGSVATEAISCMLAVSMLACELQSSKICGKEKKVLTSIRTNDSRRKKRGEKPEEGSLILQNRPFSMPARNIPF